MNHLICNVGECRNEATRRLEIRRVSSDELPAEVRPLCSDPLCETLARSSAAGFRFRDHRIVPFRGPRVARIARGLDRLRSEGRAPLTPAEKDRARVEAAGFPEGLDYEALILAEDEERFGD